MISISWTNLPHRIATVVVFAAALLWATAASAEMPKHAPADPAAEKSMHDPAHPMAHGDHQMSHDASVGADDKIEHAGHGMTEHEHVHPTADTITPGSVELDEQLGARIPLDLSFRDEKGNPVRLGDLITRPTVIAPVYYRCPNVCHFLQGDLARVLPEIKLKAGVDYEVLSISFDETETPDLAKRSRDTYYIAMNEDYPPEAWRFLTGDRDAIQALTDAAGYHFQRIGAEFLHPVAFFVVTPDGMIVRYLHGTHILPKDLTLALYEAREGRVGQTIRKVVQYCFSFDPKQKTYVFNVLRVSATVILVTLGLFLAFLVMGGKKRKRGSKS